MTNKRKRNVTSITTVVPVRLMTSQVTVLQTQLPAGISVSAICRALLQAYLEGKIPQANTIILLEVARAQQAKSKYQFKPKENEDGRTESTPARISA